jgi:adenylate kinase family enzyme
MRRVLIVGNSGAGKSTLARRLGDKLGLPVIHLDVLFWKPGWIESEDGEFHARIEAFQQEPAWISDGNFGGSWHLRMPAADTIIWLDLPPLVCLARAIWRVVQYRDGTRPDMAEGCREAVDLQFYHFILSYNRKVRPRLEKALAEHCAHARIVRLRSDREIADFLAQA